MEKKEEERMLGLIDQVPERSATVATRVVEAADGCVRVIATALDQAQREPGAVEFVHTLDALLGGLCAAGFVIEDLAEPPRADALAPPGTAGHRAWFLPPYLKVKARRR